MMTDLIAQIYHNRFLLSVQMHQTELDIIACDGVCKMGFDYQKDLEELKKKRFELNYQYYILIRELELCLS